jgi:DNA repair protein RadB
VYGPAGSGKTNVGLCAVASVLMSGKKAIYIDTEGSFSVERMLQIFPGFKEKSGNLLFLKPTNFDEQKNAFETLNKAIYIEKQMFDLIVIDSIAMLYRLEIGKNQDIYNINRELGRQLGLLTELARKKNIPIIITNQVYSDFESNEIKMVGGDLLKYSSKCLIELRTEDDGSRVAILKKHRSISEGTSVKFKIVEKGMDNF